MRLKGSFGCTKIGVSSSSHWSSMMLEPECRSEVEVKAYLQR
jgi:hypothetical protein